MYIVISYIFMENSFLLSQFRGKSIKPSFEGNNELTLSNLSLTVVFVIICGFIFFKASYADAYLLRYLNLKHNVNKNSYDQRPHWNQILVSYNDLFEINYPELYKERRFVAAVYIRSILGEPIRVTRYIIFENFSDEELLDYIYYMCLYSHKHMSEKQFYLYNVDEKYYNFDFDVDFKTIEDYKW